MRNRIVLTLIALAMSLSVLVGCGTSAPPKATQPAQSASAGEATAQPTAMVSAEPVEIEIFGQGVSIPETDPIIPALDKKLNIKLKYTASAEWENELGVRIAGGNIPDVFQIPYKNLSNYARDGILLAMDGYMDRIPNVVKVTRQEEWNKVTIDGKKYAIGKRPEDNFSCMWIRYDWRNKMGEKMPTTLDELYNLALKIKAADLDGNKKDDTYPIGGTINTTREFAFNGFFTAYGVAGPGNIVAVDGQAKLSSMLPQFKEAIVDIKRFVDAGLIDPEIVANDSSALTEKMAAGKVAIVYTGWNVYGKQAAQDSLKAVDPNAKWGHMDAMTGPYGVTGAPYDMSGSGLIMGINADLAENEAKLNTIFSLFEYVSQPEGEDLVCYGIEGTHYKVENGQKVKLAAMNDLGYSWQLQLTGRNNMAYCIMKFPECADEVQYAAKDVKRIGYYENLVIPPSSINLADIKSYEMEQILAFIFGTRDIGEYDDFINTLTTVYHVNDYLAEAQKQLTAGGYIK